MAYDIKIGEFSINNEDSMCLFVEAKKVTRVEAPAVQNGGAILERTVFKRTYFKINK